MVIRQSRFNTYDSAKAKHSNTVHFPAPCDPSSTSTSQFNHNKHKPNTTCNPQSYCNPGAIPTSTRNSCTKRPGNIEPGEGHREALSPGSHRTAPATTQRKSYIPTDHVQTDTPAQQTQTRRAIIKVHSSIAPGSHSDQPSLPHCPPLPTRCPPPILSILRIQFPSPIMQQYTDLTSSPL